jgi:hypothetical protein
VNAPQNPGIFRLAWRDRAPLPTPRETEDSRVWEIIVDFDPSSPTGREILIWDHGVREWCDQEGVTLLPGEQDNIVRWSWV